MSRPDTGGSPMSDVAKMTERRSEGLHPPLHVNLTQNIEIDTELMDEFCLENETSHERMQCSRGL